MKWLTTILIFGFTNTQAQNMQQLFYYLKVTTNNVELKCLINGFPVYDITSQGQITNQVPVNLALIGKENELKIVAKSLGENAVVEGGIDPYSQGDIVSTDDDQKGNLEFEFPVDGEVTKTFTFNNDRFDFRKTLMEGEVIVDTEVLRDYGMKILGMFGEEDSKTLLKEMGPKIKDTAAAFSADFSAVEQSLDQMLNENFFGKSWEKITREDIEPISYCNGRVWELKTSGDQPLVLIKQNDGEMYIKVYVASFDGQLRIVR